MKWVPLNHGVYAAVDDEDFAELSRYHWRLDYNGYPHRKVLQAEPYTRKHIRMHQQIMNPEAGMVVDHINHIKIDNRRCNLRVCTQKENARNKAKYGKNPTSAYRGVSLDPRRRETSPLYRAHICVNGKNELLGYFELPEDAARAYNEAAQKYHGEFAQLNPLPS